MAKINGMLPQAMIQKLINPFKNEVMVRHNNLQDKQRAVALTYTCTRQPGIHHRKNPLEVRYSCMQQVCNLITGRE